MVEPVEDEPGDSLTAHAYVTGGVLVGYNTFTSTGLYIDSSYYVDVDAGEFAQISITPTITPKVSGSWGIFTPKDTFLIGQQTLGALTLSYSNPVSATLAFANNQSPSLTVNASGELGFTAALVPDLTEDLTYEDSVTLYQVSSGNLLA